MTLIDKVAERQIIGCLVENPKFLLEYPDISPIDFHQDIARICFVTIKSLLEQGAEILTPFEIDKEIEKAERSAIIYKQEHGLEFLQRAIEYSEINNFKLYYNRLKKYSLLRRLHKEKYDISAYYQENSNLTPQEEMQLQENFDEASVEDILNNVESRYNQIRNDFLNSGHRQGDPAEGIFQLIDELQKTPNIGPELEGKIFSSACRGARQGCFFLKSLSTASGKTRTSVFDACRLAYPIRYSHEHNTFVSEIDHSTGEQRKPRKVLFIVTEMDKEELQTIMLAYLSGVDEAHILTGKYEFGELNRVKFAAYIMQTYRDSFIIEEISEPNLVNIEATIKKYVTIDNIKYCFFDYIHSTASMVTQFERNGLAEHTILMLFANQLKQLAKDYNIFIFSATQVNASAMMDDGEFKNETCIRGSKAVSDKCDVGYVMTKVSEKLWNVMSKELKMGMREGIIDPELLIDNNRPTHVIDIYKMRRGQFKNVRIWTQLHLGTGARKDLFLTTAENQPLQVPLNLFTTVDLEIMENWESLLKENGD